MKRLFNRGKWLWLESTNPLIMSYMNEKKNTSNLIASEITSTWFFLLLIKIFVFPIYLGIKGLYVSKKIIFFPFLNHTENKIPQYHYANNCWC